MSRDRAGAPSLGGLVQADVARARTFGVGLAVERDLFSFVQGIKRDRLALTSMKENFLAVAGRDEADPAVSQLLDLSHFHQQHLLRCRARSQSSTDRL